MATRRDQSIPSENESPFASDPQQRASDHPQRDETERERGDHDPNADPITGEPGAHPVGTGLGAAAGGAALGSAAGAVAGPLGAGVGAVVGGVAGAYVGKELAEQIDPTVEENYWREEYPKRDYYSEETKTEEVLPAYRYGWESRAQHRDRTWDEVEPELGQEWQDRRGQSTLEWNRARHATRDAWERVERNMPKAASVEKAEANTRSGQSAGRSSKSRSK